MSYLQKTKETFESTKIPTNNFVGYSMPSYMKHLPERKLGTGNVKWEELNSEQRQIATDLHPTIANAVYGHQKKILNAQKLDSIIALARVLDDENLEKALTALQITPEHLLLDLK